MITMADKIRQIEAFLSVAETKNFTRAGEAIGLSQPALSLLINQFEQHLGLKLFDRTTRSVELTPAGREFLPDAERILQDLENSIESLKNVAAVQKGRLRIVALPSLCSALLPRLLNDFQNLYPGIEIGIREALGEPLLESVAEGSSDFGLGVQLENREGIRFEKLFDDEMVMLCQKTHPLAGRKSITWKKIANETVIAMGLTTTARRMTEIAAAQNNMILNYAFEVDYMASAIGLARSGLGISILPSTALTDLNLLGISTVRLTSPVAKRAIGILTRSDRLLSPAAREFVRLLTSMPKSRLLTLYPGPEKGA